MCGSTYTWIFFFNGIELHDPWLTESTDAEWQAQRADHEVIQVFSDAVGQLSTIALFKGQIVHEKPLNYTLLKDELGGM